MFSHLINFQTSNWLLMAARRERKWWRIMSDNVDDWGMLWKFDCKSLWKINESIKRRRRIIFKEIFSINFIPGHFPLINQTKNSSKSQINSTNYDKSSELNHFSFHLFHRWKLIPFSLIKDIDIIIVCACGFRLQEIFFVSP